MSFQKHWPAYTHQHQQLIQLSSTIARTFFSYSRRFSWYSWAARLLAGLFGFGSSNNDWNSKSNNRTSAKCFSTTKFRKISASSSRNQFVPKTVTFKFRPLWFPHKYNCSNSGSSQLLIRMHISLVSSDEVFGSKHVSKTAPCCTAPWEGMVRHYEGGRHCAST